MNGLQVPSVFMRYNLWKYTDFEVEMHEAPFAVDSMRYCSRVGRAGSDVCKKRGKIILGLRTSTPIAELLKLDSERLYPLSLSMTRALIIRHLEGDIDYDIWACDILSR